MTLLNTYSYIGSNVISEEQGVVNISASSEKKAREAATVYFTTVKGYSKIGLTVVLVQTAPRVYV